MFFIGGTAILGIITALVAYFGKVKVSVLTLDGSYDSPRVLFLIGFAATMAGPPLLKGLFKSPGPGGRGDQQERGE